MSGIEHNRQDGMWSLKGWNQIHRINFDDFFADLICDVQTEPATWHCLVQRQGGTQILFWSQALSRQEAVRTAQEALRDLKTGSATPAQRKPTLAEKKFMTLHETTRRLRSRR
jgi:hypothetical protein